MERARSARQSGGASRARGSAVIVIAIAFKGRRWAQQHARARRARQAGGCRRGRVGGGYICTCNGAQQRCCGWKRAGAEGRHAAGGAVAAGLGICARGSVPRGPVSGVGGLLQRVPTGAADDGFPCSVFCCLPLCGVVNRRKVDDLLYCSRSICCGSCSAVSPMHQCLRSPRPVITVDTALWTQHMRGSLD